ncbi:hypothetical protein IFM89_025893, partial [Coptis chinensis]
PEDTEVQAPDESSTLLMLEDRNDEYIQSVLSPEDGSSNVTASASGTNPTETNHPNILEQTWKERESMNSSLDTISTPLDSEVVASKDLTFNQYKPVNIDAEQNSDVGSVLLRSDPFTLTTPHDSEEIKNETEDVPIWKCYLCYKFRSRKA